MGGPGSGNHWRASRDKCEAYTRVDIRYLRKRGMLAPGCSGSLSWNRGDEPAGYIRFKTHFHEIELSYRYRQTGAEDWQEVNERIPLVTTDQYLGGRRRWLVCLSCRGRCAVLYGGTHYRCRKCWNLAYKSQHEPPHERAYSQAQKLRQRLGGSQCLDDPFPEKPKGMHRRTYDRLWQKGEALEDAADAQFAMMVAAYLR